MTNNETFLGNIEAEEAILGGILLVGVHEQLVRFMGV